MKVVVVGAGLSGLIAARGLLRAGVEVEVIEARERVGGRTCSEIVEGVRLDFGGQWIGPDQKRVNALVRELGLHTFPTFQTGAKVLEVGGKISQYQGEIPSLPPLQLIELELALRRADSLSKKPDLHWDLQTVAQWRDRHIVSHRVRSLLNASLRVVFGAEAEELSMYHFLSYVHTAGGLMRLLTIEGGAQQDRLVEGTHAISRLLAETPGMNVKTGAAVRKVVEKNNSLQVYSDAGIHSCDRLVLAVPPALSARIEWDPPVPAIRDQLCQRFPMGGTIKCFALYEKPFWREAGFSGEVVVADGNPLTVVFDNTTAEGVPCLLGFIVGRDARVWGAAPAEVRKTAVLSALRRWFGDVAARPFAYAEKDWAQDPWTRGCPIGVAAPGVLSTLGDALRGGWGRVHVAGTESAQEWTGFLEGAIEAGERVVGEVLRGVHPT